MFSLICRTAFSVKLCHRHYASFKRFYKNTNILSNEDGYEITLDQRKLKTPLGKVFKVGSKPLAIAIAHEWDQQKEIINRNNMHLTALGCTALDNPNKYSKLDAVNYIVNFLETDTIIFQANPSENVQGSDELYKLQVERWDPIIQWFCDRFQIDVTKTKSIEAPQISEATKSVLFNHFSSFNEEAIHGFMYAVDTVKSVILTAATSERIITVEEAIALCRLEEEFQISFWGNVEWSHELNKADLESRMAAAILFVHLNSNFATSQLKLNCAKAS